MESKNIEISLGDPSLFDLAIGKRKTKKELLSLPAGNVPIISARLDIPFGFIGGGSFVCHTDSLVLWNIDSSRWDTRVLEKNYKFIPTDHCGYMKILNRSLIPEYIAYKLYEYGLHVGFKHEYRASLSNLKDASISVPVDKNGNYDVAQQKKLAKKYQMCLDVRRNVLNAVEGLSGKHIAITSNSDFVRVSIGDFMTFEKGKSKYTEKYCKEHQGEFPVYSAGTKERTTIGHINSYDYERECLKITTNGHYAGTIEYLARNKFSLNGDAGILYFTSPNNANKIDYLYLEYALQNARDQYGFSWANKPLEDDIKSIEILIPSKNGEWDLAEQKRIAHKYWLFKDYLSKLHRITDGMNKLFVKID